MSKPNGQLEMVQETAMVPIPVRGALSAGEILQIAAERGATPEQLRDFLELKLRADEGDRIAQEHESRKAFNAAFSAFKAESVRIVKNVTVGDGPLKGKKYVDLFGVTDALTPVLSKHQLSHSWKLTKDEKDWMEVTCTIRHALGHSESASMGAAPDTGPGRNAIQARGSAKSYLERYTLLAATGFAATDDDGNGAGKAPSLGDEEFVALRDPILDAPDDDALKNRYLTAVEAAKKIDDKDAIRKFGEAKNTRYRALHPPPIRSAR